jgi:hypothetical protein
MALTPTSRTNRALYDISADQWNMLVDMFSDVGRVRISETEPDPTYDGDLWINPGILVAPGLDIFTDSFNNSSFDTARFGTWTTGTGTSVVETTELTITDNTTAGTHAMAYLKRQFLWNEKITYRLRAKNPVGTANQVMLCVWEDYTGITADFAPAHDADWYKRRRIYLMHNGNAASWNMITMAGVTFTTNMTPANGSTATAAMPNGDWYDYIIEQLYTNADKTAAGERQTGAVDNTWQIRATVKDDTGAIVNQTDWIDTSAITHNADSGSNAYYVVIGHPMDDPTDTGNRGLTAQQFQVS